MTHRDAVRVPDRDAVENSGSSPEGHEGLFAGHFQNSGDVREHADARVQLNDYVPAVFPADHVDDFAKGHRIRGETQAGASTATVSTASATGNATGAGHPGRNRSGQGEQTPYQAPR